MSSPIDNTWPSPPCANNNSLEKRKFQEDSNANVAVNVIVSDDNSALNQNAFHTDVITEDSDPGNLKVIISVVVPANTSRLLTKAEISTYSEGCARLKVNGTIVQVGRTGPSLPNILLKFDPPRPTTAGDTIELSFESRSGIAVVSVDGSISGIDYPTT